MTTTKALEILALIPARGGSKGIPGKNLRPLAGAPLVAHSISQALATPAVTKVVVTTDDQSIAQVARQWGAEVVDRPEELSGDTATSESALRHALEVLQKEQGYGPDLVVFLQPTSPLRLADEIQRAIDTLRHEEADSLFSACTVHGFVWRRHQGGLKSMTYDSAARPRRQDIGEDLLENGSIYVFKPWVLERFDNRLGGKIVVHPMDPLDSFQVDEPGDLELLESLARLRPETIATLPPKTPPEAKPLPETKLQAVKLLALDFDGVLTDDRVLVDQNGVESVRCHRGDGLGIERARRAGIRVVVISKEKNPVVAARCAKLRVQCLQGIDNKLPQLQALAAELDLDQEEILYVGNDINDLDCIHWAGVSAAPADARDEARKAVTWVCTKKGGHGAVREVCDRLLLAHGKSS